MDLKLPIVEEFNSLQGEGFHTGTPCRFIRLAGCPIRCSFCDSKNTWDASGFPSHTIEEICQRAHDANLQHIVVTGGEPFIHNLAPLTEGLKGHILHVETSGAFPISGHWDWVTISPKKNMPPIPETLKEANELKLVISSEADFELAHFYEKELKAHGVNALLFLQPDWNTAPQITPSIIQFILHHPEWRLSLQTHKYLNIQ